MSAWGVPVQVSADGSFTWTPGNRFIGLSYGETAIDTFTYAVTDGSGNMGRTTVEIIVHGVETPPTAVNVVPSMATPSLYVRANTTTTIPASVPLSGASDVGINDTLSLLSVSAASTLGASVQIVNGQVVYDPTQVAALKNLPAGQRVTDSFQYTAVDLQGQTASAQVEVIVQSPTDAAPIITPAAYAITENGVFSATPASLLTHATDPSALPGDPPLQAVAGVFPTTLGAAVTIAADGSFTYNPAGAAAVIALDPGKPLTDTFTWQAVDYQGITGTGSVTLTVTGTKQPPIAANYSFTVQQDRCHRYRREGRTF